MGDIAGADARVVIVGGGIAGMATALQLAPLPVTLLNAGPLLSEAATALAQGGIAAALGDDDAPVLHAEDTLRAGAGLVEPAVALAVAEAAGQCIRDLECWGVAFDRTPAGRLALGLEAAHSRRRIVHAGGDATGRAALAALVAAARANPSIRIVESAPAIELVRDERGDVAGVVALCGGSAQLLTARAVVLATGGIGGLFAATTNPLGAAGQGLAMAASVGAKLRDLEFVQFHPTAMALGKDPLPLASEAIRGEGAILIDDRGDRLMADVPGRELAPRDVVARHVGASLLAGRKVYLDARAAIGGRFAARFPSAYTACRAAGIDPTIQPIPIRPAAHYHMGGIAVDRCGRTTVPGLWAVGEVAATGLHGANRLASNSLLEALAFARWVAADIAGQSTALRQTRPMPPEARRREHADTRSVGQTRALRELMARSVGVVRDADGLSGAIRTLTPLVEDGEQSPGLRRRALVCRLIAEAALAREESIGSHFRSDAHAPPFVHPPAGIARSHDVVLRGQQGAEVYGHG